MKNNSKNKIRLAFKKAKEVGDHDLWGKPDESIIRLHQLPAPKLPIECFGTCGAILVKAAASKSAPVDYIAISLLSSASSLISNVRQATPWDGWVEPTILWGILVGSPSSGKSPALDVVRNIMRDIEQDLALDYQESYLRYEQEKEEAGIRKEAWEQSCRKLASRLEREELPPVPEDAREPILPPRPRIFINDTTIEKAAVIASDNPRGLCLCRDELAGLLANLERHGGSDREFYTEAYGGRPYTIDRKKNPEPIIIPRLAISILGTIQPEKLSRLLTDTEDDGFAARFLYAWPETIDFEKPQYKYDTSELQQIFITLRQLQMPENKPKLLSLSPKAESIFRNWRKNIYPNMESGKQGVMLSFIGKMPGTILRIALVLQYLDWAKLSKKAEPTRIESIYVKRSIELVTSYLIPMAERCLNEYAVPRRQLDARIIARWIKKNEPEKLNARTIRRDSILPAADVERYEAALTFLVDLGWLQFASDRSGATGRYQKAYLVNPRLFS